MLRRRNTISAIAGVLALAGLFTLSTNAAFAQSASGHGSLPDGTAPNGRPYKRQFSLSVRTMNDGTVRGNAILHNPAADGAHGNQPYMLQIDVSCMKVVGNMAFFGGMTRRTTDPNLVDAVYFSIQDNGEPGANNDRISRVFFFDDDPNTTGDPQLCQFIQPADFPLEFITSGNIRLQP